MKLKRKNSEYKNRKLIANNFYLMLGGDLLVQFIVLP